jgi:hypothetical protein
MSDAEWRTRRALRNDGMDQAGTGARRPSFASRALRNRAKSSPAWCEERVSGLDETIRKPLA